MRKLLYVPIIHMEADLGSVAPDIDQRSKDMFGAQRWEKHKETLSHFWDSIARYCQRLQATNLRLYQDGLLANGELGKRIVEAGAKAGSRNYQILLRLMERGAELVSTEDVSLVKEEYEHIIKLAQSKSLLQRGLAYFQYKMHKARLTEERDVFIARRINETLGEGQRGILFLGAYHNVLPLVAKDIVVKQLREQEKVKAYFDELIGGRDERKFAELAAYLASPVVLE